MSEFEFEAPKPDTAPLVPVEEPDEPQGNPLVEWGGQLWVQKSFPVLTEEEYVKREVGVTQAEIDSGRLTLDRVKGKGDRLTRTATYARYRYRGHLAGEIKGL